MIVELVRQSQDVPLTTPFPPSGVLVRWCKGDWCDPFFDPDGWYGPTLPRLTLRMKIDRPMPFVSWNFKYWRGYFGWKVYGYIPEYKNWWPEQDAKPESRAICFSMSLFRFKLKRRG